MSEIVLPKETVREAHGDTERTFTHPAFAQISASRVSHSGYGAVLYGSDFRHNHYVIITLHESELHRGLSRDWHFPRKELFRVAVSEAQWATFVSTLNMGSGVPSTLLRMKGEGEVPRIPPRIEEDAARLDFAETTRRAASRVADTIKALDSEIGAALSKTKRAALLSHLERLKRDLDDSMPFITKSFDEHVEGTVEKAKIEVSAYVTATVQRAGLAALSGNDAILQVPGAQSDEG